MDIIIHNGGMFKRERFKEVMEEQGRKSNWLADQLNLEAETISRYLRGERDPSKATAIAMAMYLGISPQELWSPNEDNKAS